MNCVTVAFLNTFLLVIVPFTNNLELPKSSDPPFPGSEQGMSPSLRWPFFLLHWSWFSWYFSMEPAVFEEESALALGDPSVSEHLRRLLHQPLHIIPSTWAVLTAFCNKLKETVPPPTSSSCPPHTFCAEARICWSGTSDLRIHLFFTSHFSLATTNFSLPI